MKLLRVSRNTGAKAAAICEAALADLAGRRTRLRTSQPVPDRPSGAGWKSRRASGTSSDCPDRKRVVSIVNHSSGFPPFHVVRHLPLTSGENSFTAIPLRSWSLAPHP